MRKSRSLFFICLLLFSSALWAQEWNPEPPKPVHWDWIRLTSGEWLKGELIALYDDELEFESDELDELVFDWEDVSMVRTGRIMQVRFLGNVDRTGQLVIEGDTVQFVGEEQRYPREDVLTITAGEARELNYWDVKISVGLNVRSGNSDQLDLNNTIKLRRRTVANRLVLDYIANYSETEDIETANNHRVTAAWDKFLTDRLFVRPVSLEFLKDPFQNIDVKYNVSVGLGYQIVDTSTVEWLVVAGPGYQKTRFDTVQAGESEEEETPSVSVTSNLDVEINKDIDFYYDYSFTFTNEASGKYNHHMVGGLEIDLGSRLDLDISLVWDRIEKPQADENGVLPSEDDYRLIVGIGFDY